MAFGGVLLAESGINCFLGGPSKEAFSIPLACLTVTRECVWMSCTVKLVPRYKKENTNQDGTERQWSVNGIYLYQGTTRVQNNRCDTDGWIYSLIKNLLLELFLWQKMERLQ